MWCWLRVLFSFTSTRLNVVLFARARCHATQMWQWLRVQTVTRFECGTDCTCQQPREWMWYWLRVPGVTRFKSGIDCACKLSRDLNVVVIARAKSKNSTLLLSRAVYGTKQYDIHLLWRYWSHLYDSYPNFSTYIWTEIFVTICSLLCHSKYFPKLSGFNFDVACLRKVQQWNFSAAFSTSSWLRTPL